MVAAASIFNFRIQIVYKCALCTQKTINSFTVSSTIKRLSVTPIGYNAAE